MGHRANYLLIDHGGHELFYSHWGANRICCDLFWGPVHAQRFIRSQREGQNWLDDVWCEGGAAMDFRSQELWLFGGDDLNYDPYLRAVWLHLMRALWEGWSIRWAERAIVDLAVLAGLPPEQVLASRKSGREAVVAVTDKRRPWCRTVATLVNSGRHFTLVTIGWETVLKGASLPGLLHGLKGRPTIEGNPPPCGLEIDEVQRTVHYWAMYGPPMLRERAEAAWPGWTVVRDDQRAFAHLKSLPFYDPPEEDHVLRTVIETLSRDYGSPVDGILALVSERTAQGAQVQVNPSALVDQRLELDADTRSLLLASGLEAYHHSGGAPAYH